MALLLESAVVLVTLVLALTLRPRRLLVGGRLLTPALATLVLLPWI